MARRSDLAHPGPHIRDRVLPKGMSVTEAAGLLGVGRPALSNLLNGRASLSPEMAARLERTFGANARELIDMQAAYDAARAKAKGPSAGARSFVPPFLQLTANDVAEWASSNIAARSRLAVLLRTLVHSTGLGVRRADFPGNEDSQRPGWDGFVEAGQGTPWIPEGKSGWEFGVTQNPKRKVDADFKKAVKQVGAAAERAEITFVFVTPQRWPGKTAWTKERIAESEWKDVRVLDASDLEQWLEQSIPAQAWLAAERRDPTQGVRSLDECWRLWEADCKPALSRSLFDEAIELAGQKVATKLRSSSCEPVVIAADSRDEALAFLSCLFSSDDPELSALRDRVAVFTEPGPLARLAAGSASFIPVVGNFEVERELASHRGSLGSILVYPRNATTVEPDLTLEPLSYTAFERALGEMGCDRDEIDRLSRESGRSPTVLRRRLSSLPAVRTPVWATDARHARGLIPFLFAGAWKANSPADQVVLESLADEPYETLEVRLAEMLALDDSPVWSISSFRGLISKIDALFAVASHLTVEDVDRLFDVALLVLSEDDAALDLPEEDQWMAGVYGKTREISGALREGIGETLVLLAVHGASLLRSRLGVDPEARVSRLIRDLLEPLDARTLEAQSGALPMYAEAAPEEFLNVLSRDLASPEPESLKLMRPVTSTFGRCPRTGLLWALENTAWAPERLHQTIDVLARLAEPEINDNWSNKPSASLSAIFRRWMPQTAANLEQRIAALDYLIDRYPKVAWPVCVAQIDWRSQVGHHSHKPRWRPDGFGHGEPIRDGREIHRVAVHALERALAWTEHTYETLGGLVELAAGLGAEYQKRLWEVVSRWAETASDEDKAMLRERVRISTVDPRRRPRSRKSDREERREVVRDRRVYEQLKPKDPVLEHAWLFRDPWVRESAGEIADEGFNFRKHEERIQAMRVEALRAVHADRGIEGLAAVADLGKAAFVAGCLLPRVLHTVDERAAAIRFLLADPDRASTQSERRRAAVRGVLSSVSGESDDALEALLAAVTPERGFAALAFLLLAPFRSATWRLAERLGRDVAGAYWRDVDPIWGPQTETERIEAVDRLVKVGRPLEAFALIQLDLEHLRPRQLFGLLRSMATSSTEPAETAPRLDPLRIAEAFVLLTESGEIPVDEMAGLEYTYVEVLDRQEAPIPNLERHLDDHPELFVQAIVATYRRSDDRQDPEEWRAPDEERAQATARKTYALLERISRIPGRDPDGEIDPVRLRDWIREVRGGCAELARADRCEYQIGALLSKAPIGRDGVWPCEPVREVLDEIATESVRRGFTIGRFNSRGMVTRGEGGHQERELAAEYAAWARALESTHPRVAAILREMVAWYEHDANREDDDARVRRRLLQ